MSNAVATNVSGLCQAGNTCSLCPKQTLIYLLKMIFIKKCQPLFFKPKKQIKKCLLLKKVDSLIVPSYPVSNLHRQTVCMLLCFHEQSDERCNKCAFKGRRYSEVAMKSDNCKVMQKETMHMIVSIKWTFIKNW